MWWAYLAIDELDVLRALSVAVASSVLGTSLVAGIFRQTTIGVHLDEVQSTVETARQVRHVDVEGELLVFQLEHRVRGVIVHQVDTGADVCVRASGYKVETE